MKAIYKINQITGQRMTEQGKRIAFFHYNADSKRLKCPLSFVFGLLSSNQKINLLLLLVVAAVLGSCSALKQTKLPENNKFGFHFSGKKQHYAKVPFSLTSNLLLVKMTIDGSDTLNFILDTGVSATIITDPSIANKIQLNNVREVFISGAGEDEPIRAEVSIGHTLSFSNDIIAYAQNIVILQEDLLNLSEYLGVKVHGIFGHELFNNFVITMDFENRQLHFHDPATFKYRKSYGEKYPIVVTQSKPYTEALALAADDSLYPLKLVIDTGAGHALMLNANDKRDVVEMPDKVIRANLGRGLNGDINGMIGRVGKIKVGNVEINNILASFPDSISFSMKFPPTDYDRQGSIGCELLRRFKVTLNYADGYMALKPVKVRMKEGYEYDMSGLEIRAEGENFDKFVVREVEESSPAGRAGLMPGDEIVFLNNKNATSLTVSEIVKLLSNKEGKEIEVFVRRNGALQFYYFTLKRFI